MSYDTVPKGASLKLEKFTLKVPQEEVDHFYQLLKLSSLAPKTYENTRPDENLFGVSHEWISNAKKHWETTYDWRKREDYINSFPHFKVQIKDDDGHVFDMHFAALFSLKQDAIPITFLHGWPGSFLEFLGVMAVVMKKYSPQDLPYHIIIPSLPGYTLSSGPPLDKEFKVEDIARIIDKVMVGLGFGDGYICQGGDIGSFTCRPLAQYPACKGIHLNFNLMGKPDIPDSEVSAIEKRALERAKNFRERGSAYSLEHGTRPATIGFVLQSSPIALFAWISEKFITWTDKTPPLDDILDSITLYWFTQTIPRCIYPYRQFFGERSAIGNPHTDPKYYIEKPFGYSYFPMENSPIPVAWVKTTGNLVWSKEHDQGGHFAALENPDLFTEDVESFVKQIWKT